MSEDSQMGTLDLDQLSRPRMSLPLSSSRIVHSGGPKPILHYRCNNHDISQYGDRSGSFEHNYHDPVRVH
jgi:5,10-methylenetetrahydrofolate reductase